MKNTQPATTRKVKRPANLKPATRNPKPTPVSARRTAPSTPAPRLTAPSARILVIDLAKELGVWRNAIFRALLRLGIRHQLQLDPARSHNVVATISSAEAKAVTDHLNSPRKGRCRPDPAHPAATPTRKYPADELGYFYIVQLEPHHDPLRLKLGFTNNLTERLRAFRTALPFAELFQHWPARRCWEQAAIHCISRGCERLQGEVIRARDLKSVLRRARSFFRAMPDLTRDLARHLAETSHTYPRRCRPKGWNERAL